MTTSSLCLLCALAAGPPVGVGPVYVPLDPDQVLIRAQSPQVHSTRPWGGSPLGAASPWVSPAASARLAQQPYSSDPFLEPNGFPQYGTPPGSGPYGNPPIYNRFDGPMAVTGINGPQPYRYGWQSRLDAGYLPGEDISRGSGEFSIFELDTEFRNTMPVSASSAFSYAPQLGLRTWDGATLTGGGDLPNAVYRLGSDFEYSTSASGPWSYALGFTPSINTDFESSLDSDAFNFDARALLFYRASAEWMYVLGVSYLDRVDDYILPNVGAVWTPTDRTELRLMFPESRVSHYIGNYFSDDKWVYASAGFHVESYQIEIDYPGMSREEQIQLSDWRAVIGLRSENDYISTFIEGGIVFEREVEFRHGTEDFDIDSGFILRGGLRF